MTLYGLSNKLICLYFKKGDVTRMWTKEIPRYMTLVQTKEYLNIGSYNTLYKLIDKGLKVSVIGGVKRIDRQEADRFMQSMIKED